MNKILIIFIIFILFFFAVNVQASIFDKLPKLNILPDNPLYTLKIWYEQIITFFNFGVANKAERYSELAKKRLEEAEKMAEKGKDELTQKLLAEYDKFLNKASIKAEELKKAAEQEAKERARTELRKKYEEIRDKIQKLITDWREAFIK